MNHKWKDDQCIHCGTKRKKATLKLLMAIVNHPPYNCYKYERIWIFSFGADGWTSQRPTCEHKNLHNQNLNNGQVATIE